MPGLLERLGLASQAPPVEPLLERLQATAERTWERLAAAGRLHPAARPPRLDLPLSYREVLRAALALERVDPKDGSSEHAEGMAAHYLEVMPSYRVEQLSVAEAPNDFLFHAPLDWSRLTRFANGLGRILDLLHASGVAPEKALGVASVADFQGRFSTLGELYESAYFGSFLPLLYAFPGDLAAYRRELDASDDPWAVVDYRLSAPLLHELMHFGRDREAVFPPYLDECLAGYLGVHALPAFAYPEEGEDNALFCSPWFAQVGQSMARAFGLDALVRAQTGHTPWREAFPPALIEAVEQLGWSMYAASREPHFLVGNTRPEPWIKLFYLGAAERLPSEVSEAALAAIGFADIPPPPDAPELERRMLSDALASMCLHNFLDAGAYRVERAIPPGPVVLDFVAGTCSRESAPNSVDIAPPRYTLPPSLAARYRASGRARVVLEPEELIDVEAAVEALRQG